MSKIKWLTAVAVVIMLAAAAPLKANLSRNAANAEFAPAPQVSPSDITRQVDMRSLPATAVDDMSFVFSDPIMPADSIANAEARGAGRGPRRGTDW